MGKTLLAALLSRISVESGYSVLVIDADPDANLAATLGFPRPEDIVPISEMDALIEERTGAKPGQTSPYFRLNPKVDDLPGKYAVEHQGVRLMAMGRIKRGGTGCYCPEGALLQALLAHLLVVRDEVVILDMEAGIEHLSRGTARAVDRLLVVVEPGRRSIETASRINALAQDIGLHNVSAVGNKIRNQSDKQFLVSGLPHLEFLGFIPYDQAVADADIAGIPVTDSSQPVVTEARKIFQALESHIGVLSQINHGLG